MSALPQEEPMVPLAALHATEHEHRVEMAKERMRLIRYRLALEAAGVDPPDDDGEDLLKMWRDCQAVIDTAHRFVIGLGTSKEMLDRWA